MRYFKHFIIAVAILAFAITSCKKDDNDDKNKPFIEMLGYSTVYVAIDMPYDDAGAIAWDVTATGDTINITDRMITVNNVDTHAEGTYEVTYNVQDEAGNAADEKVRTVKVVIGK